jgi:gluconolactonase
VASGFRFTEGPVFSRIGYLLFSDIPSNRIMQMSRGEVAVFRENSNSANGLTFDHQGRLLACEKGRVTRTEKDAKITVLAGGVQAPNDLVYAIDGSVYFSDLPGRKVYQVTRKGELRAVASDFDAPNGVALGPKQLTLYVADSKRRNVSVFDVAGDGSLSRGRILAEIPDAPDGLKTDEAGNLYVAGAGAVWVFTAGGRRLGKIAFPESPSNCNWGPGFRGLYVTARTSVYHIPTRIPGTRTY